MSNTNDPAENENEPEPQTPQSPRYAPPPPPASSEQEAPEQADTVEQQPTYAPQSPGDPGQQAPAQQAPAQQAPNWPQYAPPQYAPPPQQGQAPYQGQPSQAAYQAQSGQPGQPGQPGQGTYGAPAAPQAPKESNMVGLIGFIVAVVGFIFACIPMVTFVSWILLPAAIVLGIVALCLKNKKRAFGIAALGVAVVGAIVSAVVFIVSVTMFFGQTISDLSDLSELDDNWSEGPLPDPTESDESSGSGDILPLGTPIEAGDWTYTVNDVDFDAVDEIAGESMNGEPDSGMTYIMVNITAEYSGSDSGVSAPTVFLEFVDVDGTRYTEMEKLLSSPEDFDLHGPVDSSGSATGNLSIQVPEATAQEGTLAMDLTAADWETGEVLVAVK